MVVLVTALVLSACGDDGESSADPPKVTITAQEDTTTTSTSVATTTTEPPPATSPPTAPETTVPPASPCERAAVTNDLALAAEEVLSDPTCVDEWGWIDACPASQADPEMGCTHVGKVIHRVNGTWTIAGALLQDCAESFTALGAPIEIATQFYSTCNTPAPPPTPPPTPASTPDGVPSSEAELSTSPQEFFRQFAATWESNQQEKLAWFAEPDALTQLPDPTLGGLSLLIPDPWPVDCLQGSSGMGGCELLIDDNDGVCCASIWFFSYGVVDGRLRISEIRFSGDAG